MAQVETDYPLVRLHQASVIDGVNSLVPDDRGGAVDEGIRSQRRAGDG